ncbi:MAG: triose-phosphate isomerase [Phycisphaerales bacterium]|nr:triose-phosphate isomerase [Phycisphaerales bacterium]
MSTRTPIVGGNWKMNTTAETGVALARAVAAGSGGVACEVVVYPPFPYLATVGATLAGSDVQLGAQDLYHEPNGAFTGEVSVEMLRDVGVTVVLAGHSERRHVIGETDDLVNRKVRAALAGDLMVTLCLGETLEQREAGRTTDVVLGQLRHGLAGVAEAAMGRVVLAYEPVWAIGTGVTATPDDAETAHRAIRGALADLYNPQVAAATRIQYGGSVKPGNAAALAAGPNVDGFLVGGASLVPDDFLAITRMATAPDPAADRQPEARNA